MSKLKLLCFMLACGLQALTVEEKPITDFLTTKGKISSHQVEHLHLPFYAKVKPLQPFGHVVEKGEAIFTVEYLTQNETLNHLISEYHQEVQSFAICTQHLATQQSLAEIGAISQKAFQEERIAYGKKHMALMIKKDTISKTLIPYGLSIHDIDQLEDTSIEGINAYVEKHVPNLIYAPISGILLPTSQDPNTDIFKGYTHIAKVVDHHAFEINLLINEKQLCQTHEGQSVSITIPSTDQKLDGVVFNVNPYPKNESAKSQYSVTIRFLDLPPEDIAKIHLGMSCIVNIALSEKNALMIPLTAVQTLKDKSMVILSDKDKFKGIREVTLGQTHGNEIEVLSGLKAGEEILEHYSNQ